MKRRKFLEASAVVGAGHAAHEEVHRAHPDWIEQDRDGNVVRHWVMPDMFLTCRFGPYNFEHMPLVVEEVLTRYDVDAVFANRWVEYGSFRVCYCVYCRQLFRERYALDLPREPYSDEPSWKLYMRFYQERIAELWRLWDATCKKTRPGTTFVGKMSVPAGPGVGIADVAGLLKGAQEG
jgi:hypothetical protein